MEFPSQIMASRVGFAKWLPFLMTCWGIVSCFQAFMHNQTGFYITRALIGAFEGGFIPASITFISNFYTSKELAIRLAVFWSTLNLARVVSALLAAGILQMRGAAGRPGWFWLFVSHPHSEKLSAILIRIRADHRGRLDDPHGHPRLLLGASERRSHQGWSLAQALVH